MGPPSRLAPRRVIPRRRKAATGQPSTRPRRHNRKPAPPPQDTFTHALRTFEDVTALVASQRDIELELALERLKVTHFNPNGDIIFIAAPDQPRELVRNLKALLEEHTEIEWRIRSTDAPSAPVESLADRRRREEARAMDELKRQPFVAQALKHFPNAEVKAVRQPVEENSGGGDVAPFPKKQTPAQQAPRKKEADR
jgi:hypothetical protein